MSNIDIFIVIGFLLLNLTVGFYYGKNIKTIRSYALGDRKFSTTTLVSTIVATWVSGSGFFITLSRAYSDGLAYIMMALGMGLSLLIIGFVIVPRMQRFMGMASVGELMGDYYGKNIRSVTAIAGMFSAAGGIAVQFKVFGNMLDYSLGIPAYTSIIIAAVVMVLYSTYGGIRSISYTDVLQFFIFGFVIPLLGIIIWHHINSAGIDFTDSFKASRFNFTELFNYKSSSFWEMLPLILYFIVPQIGQETFQRISIGQNIYQVKKAFIISAAFFICIKLAIAWIPFLIFSINPNLDPNGLISYIIDNYTYIGLKGLIVVAIMAMSMSTADADLNAASVLFSYDFCGSLGLQENKQLLYARMFSLGLGVFSIFLALSHKDLLSIVLTANSFYMPVVTVPLLLTIFGFRTTTAPVAIGMVAGVFTVVVWYLLDIPTDCIIFGMVANLVFLLSSHYLLNYPNKDNVESLEEYKDDQIDKMGYFTNVIKNSFYELVSSLISKINFISFCEKVAPKKEAGYTGFGIYCIIYTLTTIYSTKSALLDINSGFVFIICQIMLVIGVLLTIYPIWPPKIKSEKVLQIIWPFIVFFMLLIFSTFFILLNNNSFLQPAVFILNIVIVAMLINHNSNMAFILSGNLFGYFFYQYFVGSTLSADINPVNFVFLYSLLIAFMITIIFIKPEQFTWFIHNLARQQLDQQLIYQMAELENSRKLKQEFINNVSHEYNAPLTGLFSTAETLWKHYSKLTAKQRKEAAGIIFKSSTSLKSFHDNIQTLARLSQARKLKLEELNLSDLLYESLKACRALYDHPKGDREYILTIEPKIIIKGDRFYITHIFDNIITNAIEYCSKGKISIFLNQEGDNIYFLVHDTGIGIDANDLYSIFEAFYVGSFTKTPAGGRGLGLAISKQAVDAHKGLISAHSKGRNHGSMLRVILPKNFENTNQMDN